MLSSPALPRTIGFGCTHQVYSWNWVFWWWHPLAILSEKTVHIQDSDILRSLSFHIYFVQLCFSVPLRLKTTIKECVYVQPKLVWISSALFTIQFLTIYKCSTYNVYQIFKIHKNIISYERWLWSWWKMYKLSDEHFYCM